MCVENLRLETGLFLVKSSNSSFGIFLSNVVVKYEVFDTRCRQRVGNHDFVYSDVIMY